MSKIIPESFENGVLPALYEYQNELLPLNAAIWAGIGTGIVAGIGYGIKKVREKRKNKRSY